MSKIEITEIKSPFASTNALNTRFQKIENELNDKVLYRDCPAGEPNTMVNDLDMGDKDILNVNLISANDFKVAGEDITAGLNTAVANANLAMVAAQEAQSVAETYKDSAETSATASEASKNASLAIQATTKKYRDEAETFKTDGQAIKNQITSEGNIQVQRVTSTGNSQVARVQNTTPPEIIKVQAEGNKQVARVATEGDGQEHKLQREGDLQYNRISTLSTQSQTDIRAVRDQGVAAMVASKNSAVTQVDNTRDRAVATMNSKETSTVATVNSAASSAVDTMNAGKTSAINTMNAAKASAISQVEDNKNQAVTSITNTKNSSISTMNTASTDAINAMTRTKDSSIALVEDNKNQAVSLISNLPKYHVDYSEVLQGEIRKDFAGTILGREGRWRLTEAGSIKCTSLSQPTNWGEVTTGILGTGYDYNFGAGTSIGYNAYGVIVGDSEKPYILIHSTNLGVYLHPKYKDVRSDFTVGKEYKVFVFEESSTPSDQQTGTLDVAEFFSGINNLLSSYKTVDGYREDQQKLSRLSDRENGWRAQGHTIEMDKSFTYDLRPKADYTSKYATGTKIPYMDAYRLHGNTTDPNDPDSISAYFNVSKVHSGMPYKFKFEYLTPYGLSDFFLGVQIKIYSAIGGTGTLLQTINMQKAVTGIMYNLVNQHGSGLTSWLETEQEEVSFKPNHDGFAVVTPYCYGKNPEENISLWKMTGLGNDTHTVSEYVTIQRKELIIDFVSIQLEGTSGNLLTAIPLTSYATLNVGKWSGKTWESHLLNDIPIVSENLELPLARKAKASGGFVVYVQRGNKAWQEFRPFTGVKANSYTTDLNNNKIICNLSQSYAGLGYISEDDLRSNAVIKVEYKTDARIDRSDTSKENLLALDDKVYMMGGTRGAGLPRILYDLIGEVPTENGGSNAFWGSVLHSSSDNQFDNVGHINYVKVAPRYSEPNAVAVFYRLFKRNGNIWLQKRFKELILDSDWGDTFYINENGDDYINTYADDNGNVILRGVVSHDTGIPANP